MNDRAKYMSMRSERNVVKLSGIMVGLGFVRLSSHAHFCRMCLLENQKPCNANDTRLEIRKWRWITNTRIKKANKQTGTQKFTAWKKKEGGNMDRVSKMKDNQTERLARDRQKTGNALDHR